MDRESLQGGGMFGEDYQVFISDVGQVLVLGCEDPALGGKQGIRNVSALPARFELFKYSNAQDDDFFCPKNFRVFLCLPS